MKTEHMTDAELVRYARGQGELVDALCERLEMRQGSPVIADVETAMRLGAISPDPVMHAAHLVLPTFAEALVSGDAPASAYCQFLAFTTITALLRHPDLDEQWAAYIRGHYKNPDQQELF